MKIGINNGVETLVIDSKTGRFTRLDINYTGSNAWLCTGAVILNNFGSIVRELNLTQFANVCKTNPRSLFHKNGKPKFRVTDIDHGTYRIQMCPVPKTVWTKE